MLAHKKRKTIASFLFFFLDSYCVDHERDARASWGKLSKDKDIIDALPLIIKDLGNFL
tara:strand:- start:163 stop:336 length:174 start_codon:yes stop_codon:yes gene_type:complete